MYLASSVRTVVRAWDGIDVQEVWRERSLGCVRVMRCSLSLLLPTFFLFDGGLGLDARQAAEQSRAGQHIGELLVDGTSLTGSKYGVGMIDVGA